MAEPTGTNLQKAVDQQMELIGGYIADDRWIPLMAATHAILWKEWKCRVYYEADTFFQVTRYHEVVVDHWWERVEESLDQQYIADYFSQ